MHCVHVKEVAHDSSKRFSRGRHFYKSLLLAGAQRRAGTGGFEQTICNLYKLHNDNEQYATVGVLRDSINLERWLI